jgi:hypothetical protein
MNSGAPSLSAESGGMAEVTISNSRQSSGAIYVIDTGFLPS